MILFYLQMVQKLMLKVKIVVGCMIGYLFSNFHTMIHRENHTLIYINRENHTLIYINHNHMDIVGNEYGYDVFPLAPIFPLTLVIN